jgi:hypothetical protein
MKETFITQTKRLKASFLTCMRIAPTPVKGEDYLGDFRKLCDVPLVVSADKNSVIIKTVDGMIETGYFLPSREDIAFLSSLQKPRIREEQGRDGKPIFILEEGNE